MSGLTTRCTRMPTAAICGSNLPAVLAQIVPDLADPASGELWALYFAEISLPPIPIFTNF